MNIQQLRYVVAIANSGTFREAAEKMYVTAPVYLLQCEIWKRSWDLKFFVEPVSGTFLTRRGMNFTRELRNWSKDSMSFKISMLILEEEKDEFSIASQQL